MDTIGAYLAALDDAWNHSWESLTAVLHGVTESEAAWQAACYDADPREPDWPSPGTIAWHVAHIAHCKRYYTEIIQHRGAPERPTTPPYRPTADFVAAQDALAAAHKAQRAALAALGPDDLALPASNDMSLAEFLRMMIRHDTWHASQIAVARRLWRTRVDAS